MSRQTKRWVLIGAAVAAVLAGVLIAVFAGRGHHSSHGGSSTAGANAGPVAIAATYLGVSRPQLRRQLQQGKSLSGIASTQGKSRQGLIEALMQHRAAALARARANGSITAAEEKARLAALRARVSGVVDRSLRAGSLTRRDLDAAAAYLGTSRGRLAAQISAGRTLAQIAAATPGKSAAGVTKAVVRSRKRFLAAQAASGRITRATQAALVRNLPRRVAAAVNRSGANAVPAAQ